MLSVLFKAAQNLNNNKRYDMAVVSCPHCQTRYNLTAQQIGAGRTMRCANCGNSWFQEPLEDQPRAAASTPPLPPRPAAEPEVSAGASQLFSARLILLVVAVCSVLTLTGGGLTYYLLQPGYENAAATRFHIAAPDATKGMIEAPNGLVMSDIDQTVTQDGDLVVLTFKGKVTNTTDVEMTVPKIRLQLLDERRVELDFWPVQIKDRVLEPYESTTWHVRFVNPPLERIAGYRAFFSR